MGLSLFVFGWEYGAQLVLTVTWGRLEAAHQTPSIDARSSPQGGASGATALPPNTAGALQAYVSYVRLVCNRRRYAPGETA